ncbi:MAG: hypothetical protein ABDH28_00075 [Brevinematia bacterium]
MVEVMLVIVIVNSILTVLLAVRQNALEKMLEDRRKISEDKKRTNDDENVKEVKTIANNRYDDFKDYLGI